MVKKLAAIAVLSCELGWVHTAWLSKCIDSNVKNIGSNVRSIYNQKIVKNHAIIRNKKSLKRKN
jgi:hypothetical protein